MNCLKCGVPIPDDQVFCETCLKQMEKCPIPPDYVVQVPVEPPEELQKKQSRRQRRPVKPEEQIQHQKAVIRSLSTALTLVLLMFVMCIAAFTIYFLQDDKIPVTGQNYNTSETVTPSEVQKPTGE